LTLSEKGVESNSHVFSVYERLLEDVIQSGVKTKVLLLSATPVNNQIADIRNQISFIAGGDVARSEHPAHDGAFRESPGVVSVRETARQAQSKFTTWTKKPVAERRTRELINQLGSDFFKLLDGLSIARSRAQIKRYYAKELATLGGFPERDKPRAEYPEIDSQNKFLSFQQLDQEISNLTLARTIQKIDDLTERIDVFQQLQNQNPDLISGRDGLLPTQTDTPASSADLELVTWLVIMGDSP
ncbi:MAG: hypothetical protein WD708_10710, partial [Kiritimatiellia bacterium]